MRRLPNRNNPSRPLAVVSFSALLLLVVGLVACGPGSPEERVTQTRAQYTVSLEAWFPKVEEPAEPDLELEPAEAEGEAPGEAGAAEATEEPVAEEAAEAEGEGEAGEGEATEVESGPTTTNIHFDTLVLFSGSDSLPGVTVDVTQAGASGSEKETWRVFLETEGMVKAEARQIGFELPVEFEEGDQFSVQLLKYVDPANYGEYKEYASAQ